MSIEIARFVGSRVRGKGKRQVLRSFQKIPKRCKGCSYEEPEDGVFTKTNVKAFEDIPEVKGQPLIGTLLDYTKFNGFQMERIFDLWAKRHEQYGDIFKEKMFSTYMVYYRSPKDAERLFRSETRTPTRFNIPGVSMVKKWMGLPESMINLEGEDWLRMRQEINQALLRPKSVWQFAEEQQNVCKDLVEYIQRHKDKNGEVRNFSAILDAWTLEMSGLLNDKVEKNIRDLFCGTKKAMDFAVSSVFGMGRWDFRKYKEVRAHSIRSLEVVTDIINRQKESGTLAGTTLGRIMGSSNLSEKEKTSLVYDVLCGSIETTASAIVLVLYCVTLQEEIQEKLRNEILSLPSLDRVCGKDVESMPYTGAFLKEVARLYPLVHGHIRTLRQDSTLSGYRIPAGTIIQNTSNSTQNRDDRYFVKPDRFMPERWLTNDKKSRFALTGPFGMGPRACPGRRFAAQEMRLLLIEILKNFKIEYHHRPMVSLFRGTATASEKPRFSFVSLK